MTITKDGITCTGLNPHGHYTISTKVVKTPKINIVNKSNKVYVKV